MSAAGIQHFPIVHALAMAALGTGNPACFQHVERLAQALGESEDAKALQRLLQTRPKPGDLPPPRVIPASVRAQAPALPRQDVIDQWQDVDGSLATDEIDLVMAVPGSHVVRFANAVAGMALARAAETPALRPMGSAPKDRSPVLLRFKAEIPQRPDMTEQYASRWIVGCSAGDYMEWSLAGPFGCGGFPDDWFDGWLPVPPNEPSRAPLARRNPVSGEQLLVFVDSDEISLSDAAARAGCCSVCFDARECIANASCRANLSVLQELAHAPQVDDTGPRAYYEQQQPAQGSGRAAWDELSERTQHHFRVEFRREQLRQRTADTYVTKPADTPAGIALRELGDKARWQEIRDLNAEQFPAMGANDHYRAASVLKLPPKAQQVLQADAALAPPTRMPPSEPLPAQEEALLVEHAARASVARFGRTVFMRVLDEGGSELATLRRLSRTICRADKTDSAQWWNEAAGIRMPPDWLAREGDTILAWVNEGALLAATEVAGPRREAPQEGSQP